MDETLKAFIFNQEGRYAPAIVIESEPKQVAGFIVATKDAPKIVITDMSDNLILDTIYGYVDTCTDQEYLQNKLLPALIPMQKNVCKPPVLKYSWGYWSNGTSSITEHQCKKFIKEKLSIDLP